LCINWALKNFKESGKSFGKCVLKKSLTSFEIFLEFIAEVGVKFSEVCKSLNSAEIGLSFDPFLKYFLIF